MLGPSPERRLGFRRVGATLGNTFLSAYEDQNTASDQNTNAWLPARRVSSSSLWDVQGSWKGTKDLRVRVCVGIRNLFDRVAPFSTPNDYFLAGYDPTDTDPRGRTGYASLIYAFKEARQRGRAAWPHTGAMPLSLRTADGLTLALGEWVPATASRGTVLVVHGLGEHMGRYAHVAAALCARGWRVFAYDQRGHGTSQGERGRLSTADALLVDLAAVIDAVRARSPGPLVLLGHSLGGLVVARFVAGGLETPRPAWHREVDALVLSSPALATDMTLLQKAMLAVLGQLAPNLALGNGLKAAWISRDPALVAAYEDDPLVHDRIAPRLARFVVDGGPFVCASASRWEVPTLLLYAGSDRCVDARGSAAFAAAAPRGVVTARVFEPLFHEIFNEPEKAEVLSVLGDWLDRLDISPETSTPP